MTENPKHFTLADPKEFDGDTFEVAARAFEQAAGMARLLVFATNWAERTALNSFMERNLQEGDDPGAPEWDESPQAKRIKALSEEALELEKRLNALGLAASFNPKRPPKEKK